MKYIAHRINTIEELKNLPTEYGVELDLRDQGERLIVNHDPFGDGEDFENYLKEYKHGLMILNIKSERIEYRVLELIKKYNIKEYFFLDSSFPMIYFLSEEGEQNIAVRFSEYEGIDTVMNMAGRIKWVWVDCFTTMPINKKIYDQLKSAGFQLCLVSPELQGRQDDVDKYKKQLRAEGIVFDAICAKAHNIDIWKA